MGSAAATGETVDATAATLDGGKEEETTADDEEEGRDFSRLDWAALANQALVFAVDAE